MKRICQTRGRFRNPDLSILLSLLLDLPLPVVLFSTSNQRSLSPWQFQLLHDRCMQQLSREAKLLSLEAWVAQTHQSFSSHNMHKAAMSAHACGEGDSLSLRSNLPHCTSVDTHQLKQQLRFRWFPHLCSLEYEGRVTLDLLWTWSPHPRRDTHRPTTHHEFHGPRNFYDMY